MRKYRTIAYTVIALLALLAVVFSLINPGSYPANKVVPGKAGHIRKVLVLSNSILWHEPKPDEEWYGNWGMAASCADSDFYHRLVADIHQRDSSVIVTSKNIGTFERWFETYPLNKLDSFRGADMIIIRISENVDEHTALAHNFIAYYDRLLNYLDPQHQAVRVIVDGFWRKGFRWPQPWKRGDVNVMIRDYAAAHHYPLISITHLFDDERNQAKTFKHHGVSIHPSDRGMRMIAAAIWDYIQYYFPLKKQRPPNL